MPAAEKTPCHYVSHLGRQGLMHRTIKSYLSAIRFLHIAKGAEDPFQPALHQLQYILKGVKRCEAERIAPEKKRLPVMPQVLRTIRDVWESQAADPDVAML